MLCTICNHPQRHDIDRDLLAGNSTFSALKEKYGPSLSALWRHKKHLQEKMRQTRERFQDNLIQGRLLKLNTCLEVAMDTVQTARTEGDSGLAIRAALASTRMIYLMNKMDVQIDQDTVYRLLAAPQWAAPGSLLPTDPGFLSDTTQSLADDLFSSCPEPPPDDDGEDDDQGEDDQDDNDTDEKNEAHQEENEAEISATPSLETLNGALQQLFCRLGLTVDETAPKNQREKSAKLPRKISSSETIQKLLQQYTLYKKNLAKNSSHLPSSLSPEVSPAQNEAIEITPRESLLERLHRKCSKPKINPLPSGASELSYEEYLQEKEAADTQSAPSPEPAASNQPLDTGNPPPETQIPEPETPKPRKQFLHPIDDAEEYNYAITHGHRREDRPAHIPDRRWEEDFGNPRKIKGCY